MGGHNRHFRKPKSHAIAIARHNNAGLNKTKTVKDALHLTKKRKAKSLGKLAELGIDFEYPGLVKVVGKESDEEEEPEITEEPKPKKSKVQKPEAKPQKLSKGGKAKSVKKPNSKDSKKSGVAKKVISKAKPAAKGIKQPGKAGSKGKG